jgi:hypothetical protein
MLAGTGVIVVVTATGGGDTRDRDVLVGLMGLHLLNKIRREVVAEGRSRKDIGFDRVEGLRLNTADKVADFGAFVNTRVTILDEVLEYSVLFDVQSHILFKIPAMLFAVVNGVQKFALGARRHVVDFTGAKVMVVECPEHCAAVLGGLVAAQVQQSFARQIDANFSQTCLLSALKVTGLVTIGARAIMWASLLDHPPTGAGVGLILRRTTYAKGSLVVPRQAPRYS